MNNDKEHINIQNFVKVFNACRATVFHDKVYSVAFASLHSPLGGGKGEVIINFPPCLNILYRNPKRTNYED